MSISVVISAVSDVEPDEAFRRLAAYERYPDQTTTVLSVETEQRDGDLYSTWHVDFRGGVLRWKEKDEIDESTRSLTFRQVEGDLDLFEGAWHVMGVPAGSKMIFTAELDMGIPTLAPIIDPVARQALQTNIRAILRGLFSDARLDWVEPAAAPSP
jgi:hypothetical protein